MIIEFLLYFCTGLVITGSFSLICLFHYTYTLEALVARKHYFPSQEKVYVKPGICL